MAGSSLDMVKNERLDDDDKRLWGLPAVTENAAVDEDDAGNRWFCFPLAPRRRCWALLIDTAIPRRNTC